VHLKNKQHSLNIFNEANATRLGDYSAEHSYDILGARMLWKPKEAKILKNF
jgi:hypothetical protein